MQFISKGFDFVLAGTIGDTTEHRVDRMDHPSTGDFLDQVAEGLQLESGFCQRVLLPQQFDDIRRTAQIGQDQAEEVQGVALDMPAQQQQLTERWRQAEW